MPSIPNPPDLLALRREQAVLERDMRRLHVEAQDAPDLAAWQRIRAEQGRLARRIGHIKATIAQAEHAQRIAGHPSRRYSERVTR